MDHGKVGNRNFRTLFTITAWLIGALFIFTGCEGTDTDHTDILLGGVLAGAVIYARADGFISKSSADSTTQIISLGEGTSGMGLGTTENSDAATDNGSTDNTGTGQANDPGIAAPPDKPSAPIPADGAAGITTPIELKWTGGDPSPMDTAVHDIYLDTVTPPAKRISNSQYGTSYKIFRLEQGVKYYWKVMSRDSIGQENSGPIWSFSTQGYVAPEEKYPPDIPSNPSPQENSQFQPLSIELSWTGGDKNSGDNVFYDLFIDSVQPPVSRIASGLTESKSTVSSLAEETTYYWKVQARDSSGLTSESSVWSFRTGNGSMAAVPDNPTPADGGTVSSSIAALSWTGGSSNGSAVTYKIYMGAAADTLSDTGTTTEAKWSFTEPLAAGTHFWQIRAEDEQGKAVLGKVWSFTITTSQEAAYTMIPANAFSSAGPLITLSWVPDENHSMSSLKSSKISVSVNQDMSDAAVTENVISRLVRLSTQLLPATTYYWTVEENLEAMDGTASRITVGPSQFTTLNFTDSWGGGVSSVPVASMGQSMPDFNMTTVPSGIQISLSNIAAISSRLIISIINPGTSTSDKTVEALVKNYASGTDKSAFITVSPENFTNMAALSSYSTTMGINWFTGIDNGESITRYFQMSPVTMTMELPILAVISSAGIVEKIHYGEISENTLSDLLK
ncbi:MAG: hypothetical protein CVV64_07420 [Candidatus Wallbacteria bacterium HGW-Wallbacteria-1]|jgi:hypothetical protein|uniref:Fibronectin type-III domain-containing protein n=1 Tax=Candidatus Wallbacteria bacterium HGW-Wallbacteria-1 TaxID=2013854 RepID=A0A2N1PR10_9BACT|nr:MAG: hypothetical protein CVV64_07420 [Candidatus Wallbacteria bacterium HGW-Wallbacteria-1]